MPHFRLSHWGIKGNEEADRLAKEGSHKEQPDVPLEYINYIKI
jgi:hypothetical protein